MRQNSVSMRTAVSFCLGVYEWSAGAMAPFNECYKCATHFGRTAQGYQALPSDHRSSSGCRKLVHHRNFTRNNACAPRAYRAHCENRALEFQGRDCAPQCSSCRKTWLYHHGRDLVVYARMLRLSATLTLHSDAVGGTKQPRTR